VKDKLYAVPHTHIVDFAFDQEVADVFPDMIRRSVPGYETVISLLSIVAQRYFKKDTRVYDLGCSLGAATLAVHSIIGSDCQEYVAVDNSESMVDGCRAYLDRRITDSPVRCIEGDIRDVDIRNASVVILNFTLQFLPVEDRAVMIARLYKGLVPGGVLIVSEKVVGGSEAEDQTLVALSHGFKAANGYSDLEISQKRTALEKVMVLDSIDTHFERLRTAGFSETRLWYQCFNFVSMFAVK